MSLRQARPMTFMKPSNILHAIQYATFTPHVGFYRARQYAWPSSKTDHICHYRWLDITACTAKGTESWTVDKNRLQDE